MSTEVRSHMRHEKLGEKIDRLVYFGGLIYF